MANQSTVYGTAIELALARGHRDIKGKAVTVDVDGTWSLTFNGKSEEHEGIPPYHLALSFNGWPAGIVGPTNGVIAAGEAANEDTCIAALEAALSLAKETDPDGTRVES